MNIRIKLVIEYQKTHDELIFEKIVKEFNKLVNYHLHTIPYDYKKDIKQEMLIGLYKVISNKFIVNKNITLNKTLFSLDNLFELENDNFNNLNKYFKSNYLTDFIKIYGKELFRLSFYSDEYKKLFLFEYMLFCNERQLTYYLNKTFDNIKKDFFRSYLDDEYLALLLLPL